MPRDIVPELLRLISESGKPVKQIAQESNVGYHKLVRWVSGKVGVLNVTDAERVYRNLSGGKDFV